MKKVLPKLSRFIVTIMRPKDNWKLISMMALRKFLNNLEDPNKKIFITTSKNEPIAPRNVPTPFGDYWIFWRYLWSTLAAFHKADVLQRAIIENQAPKNQSVIVGDTKFDLIGGKTVGIKTIAVTWGFGTNETLLAENPDF